MSDEYSDIAYKSVHLYFFFNYEMVATHHMYHATFVLTHALFIPRSACAGRGI